jgi:hypothetical protein
MQSKVFFLSLIDDCVSNASGDILLKAAAEDQCFLNKSAYTFSSRLLKRCHFLRFDFIGAACHWSFDYKAEAPSG